MSDYPVQRTEGRRIRETEALSTWFGSAAEAVTSANAEVRPSEPNANAESATSEVEVPQFPTPGYGTPAPSDSPLQPMSGFRAERRFSDPTAVLPVVPGSWDDAAAPRGIAPLDPSGYGGADPLPPAAPAVPVGAPLAAPPRRPSVPPTPYPDLDNRALLRQARPAPSSGWRRWIYALSGGLLNLGKSPRDVHQDNLVAHVNQPMHGCYKMALLSLKGGVGKTTITAALGATFASIRGDRVIAVDANPDRGTLSQKVPLETAATVRNLLRDADRLERYSDVRGYTSQGPSRLEVLASESDPAVSEAFSSEDYLRTLDVLERFYSLVLTDCGTGLMHSAMAGVLAQTDTLIVISSGSVDGARSAAATLDWLDAHGYDELVRNSVAVVNAVRPRSGKVDLTKVVDHFSRRCRAVRLVPFDPHLEEGGEVSLDRLKPATREALIELAAVVADGFPAAAGENQR